MTRKSTPTLTERQRRRQIIDLLAGQLARMTEAVKVSAPRGRDSDAGCAGLMLGGSPPSPLE